MRSIESHPGVPLIEHLQRVANNGYKTIGKKALSVRIDQKIMQDLAYIEGATHDVGKATAFFIYYLNHPEHKTNGPKNHALISALLAKEVVQVYLADKPVDELDKKMLPYLVFTAVKRHHGNLQDFEDELFLDKKAEELVLQVQHIEDSKIQKMLDVLLSKINLAYDWQSFKSYVLKKAFLEEMALFHIEEFTLGSFSDLSIEAQLRYFYLHQLLYSTLLYSDKSDVIVSVDRKLIEATQFDAIERYRREKGFDKPNSELDRLKNESYQTAIEAIHQVFKPEQHFYSLTLPTGLGKTITSLAVSLQMKKILKVNDARIIITIPFTSIIDQNYAVFDSIFNAPSSDFMLKHHHMSEPKYKTSEEEFDADKSQFLIETWNSEIIVTTFVQLIEVLFTNDKSKLLKLPNLTNSIIILDEIQQINYQLWNLIRKAFDTLGKQYNCYFVLMSATQPLIFEPGKEITEIIPNHKKYFNYFTRTRIINKTREEISLDDFTQSVVDYASDNSGKDMLIVLNTKEHARICFEKLAEQVEEQAADMYFLSTLISPYERKNIIGLIKSKSRTKRQIIVSTQLIEAGVDISVDTIFRALAPLDSIIQAAGRANRYGEKAPLCEVFLYLITELKASSARIYGVDLIQKTKNVFKDIDEIAENEYLSLIEAYFQEVKKQADVIDSKELEAICALKFATLGEFSFIEERNTESVYVQLNAEAKRLWDTYVGIYKNPKSTNSQKKEEFSQIKSRFYEYVINVPIPYSKSAIDFEGKKELNFYVSKLESPSSFYHYNPHDYRENVGYVTSTTVVF